MNGVVRWIVLALALVCLTACVQAQTFPTGPISIVVPLAPGDAADISARAMGEEMSRLLNAPVLVVNRPGGGTLGANSVVQSAKNGTLSGSHRTARSPFVPFSTLSRFPTMCSGTWFRLASPRAHRACSSCAAMRRTKRSRS